MRKRRNTGFIKTLKDYAVPIVAWILFLLFLINIFSWDETPEENKNENRVWIELSLNWDDSEAYIIYSWWKEKKIKENKTLLYKWERIKVKKWTIKFSLPWIWDLTLQKFWELGYKEDWSFFLYASDLWVNTIWNFNLKTRYANVNIWENTSASINQNEVATTVYVLKWTVEIKNLWWRETILKKWQKVTIWVKDAKDEEIDISLLKKDIDDYFKASDWFLKNKWEFYLKSEDIIAQTWSTESSTWTISKNWLISLDNIWDESSVLTPTLDIVWSFEENNIWLITINNIEASISKINKKFELKWFKLKSSINDLVFKIYDESKNLLWKEIYTIYYSWGNWIKNDENEIASNEQTNFVADATKFVFTSPDTSGKYSTTEGFVTIRWKTPPNTASKVTVNWYQLKSYNWTTWRYHASVDTNNLKDWTNIYDIKYFDKSWKLILKTSYTIVKKKKQTYPKKTPSYSQEAKING